MAESSAGQAANRQMNQARGTLQRQGLWNPAQAARRIQARGNQAVGGNGADGPKARRRRLKPRPRTVAGGCCCKASWLNCAAWPATWAT